MERPYIEIITRLLILGLIQGTINLYNNLFFLKK